MTGFNPVLNPISCVNLLPPISRIGGNIVPIGPLINEIGDNTCAMETLTVPGNLDSLEPIRGYIKQAAAAANLEKKSTYRLILAVDEIATNIILHGYEEANLSGEITLIADIASDKLRITLVDSAIPYNPTLQAAPPDLGFEIEDRAIGGLGVYLTLKSLDGFEYEYKNNQNHNIFIMHRPQEN